MKTAVKNTANTVKTSPNEVSKQRAKSKNNTMETRSKNRNANRIRNDALLPQPIPRPQTKIRPS